MIHKKEFLLEDDDFNRIAEISSNSDEVVQIVDGQVMTLTNQQRVDLFWQSICVKYDFNPLTIETNVPNRDSRYFLAEPANLSADKLVNWCRLCNCFSGPDTSGGCDRAKERGCAWHIRDTLNAKKKKK